jgi:hypothetical protein
MQISINGRVGVILVALFLILFGINLLGAAIPAVLLGILAIVGGILFAIGT